MINTINILIYYFQFNKNNIVGVGFLISSVLLGVFDFTGKIVCQTMIFTKLLPDSRGVVLSILAVMFTIFSIIQSFGIIKIQDSFNTTVNGIVETDYIKGGRYTIGVYVITQFVLFVAVLIW